MLVELALLTAVVVAVGVLIDLPPGRLADEQPRPPPPRRGTPAAAPLPPAGAFVDARRAGTIAVGFAVGRRADDRDACSARTATASAGSTSASTDDRTATCGAAAIARAVARPVDGARRRAERSRSRCRHARATATPLLRRATRAYTSAQTVVFEERLVVGARDGAGGDVPPRRAEPASRTRSDGGPDAIVIGARRWDRVPGGDWEASPQTPLRVPTTYWSARARNALPRRAGHGHVLRPAASRRGSGCASTRGPAGRASCGWSRPRTS